MIDLSGEGAVSELRTAEAAAKLGVSAATMRRYADSGLLPSRVLPSGHRRYEEADVLALRKRIVAGEFNTE